MSYAPVAPPPRPATTDHGTAPSASTADRILGGVVDGVAVLVLSYLVGTVTLLLLGSIIPRAFNSANLTNTTTAVAGIALLGTYFGYNMVLELSRGQTFGKWLAKTKVVSENGAPLVAWQSFVRNLVGLGAFLLVCSVPLWVVSGGGLPAWILAVACVLAFFWIRKNVGKRRIAEMASGTLLVKHRR